MSLRPTQPPCMHSTLHGRGILFSTCILFEGAATSTTTQPQRHCASSWLCLLADFVDGHAAELASLVLEALRTYSDRRNERAVVAFAKNSAKRSDAFVKALAAGVVKQTAGMLQPGGKPAAQLLGRWEMVGLLAMTRIAIDRLDPETAKKAVAKLVEVQAALVEALMSVNIKWQVRARVCSYACAACICVHMCVYVCARASVCGHVCVCVCVCVCV